MIPETEHTRLFEILGAGAAQNLLDGLRGVGRLMPGLQIRTIRVKAPAAGVTRVRWSNTHHYSLIMRIASSRHGFALRAVVIRRPVPQIDAEPVRIDKTEFLICTLMARRIRTILESIDPADPRSLIAVWDRFDEHVIADYLIEEHKLGFDPGLLFYGMRRFAEQTYENRALTFGCIVDTEDGTTPTPGANFPGDFLGRKRFRALSDGRYTSYLVSRNGALIDLIDISLSTAECRAGSAAPSRYRRMASACRNGRLGFCLSKQGDILLLADCALQFSYRHGRWHYWNHSYYLNLLAKTVSGPTRLESAQKIAASAYLVALDISFRRSGALFVIVRRPDRVLNILRTTDLLGNTMREAVDRQFDKILTPTIIYEMPRAVAVEFASLDGAMVIGANGALLAYGAVLEPRRRRRAAAAEGSRTKAAIYASGAGASIMVSADGDIVVYSNGERILEV